MTKLLKLDDKIASTLNKAWNRYAEANIPIDYWNKSMTKHFTGSDILLNTYNKYVEDLKSSFMAGKSICFAGPNGIGKTMVVSNILKKGCDKGYNCLYTTLSDAVSVLTRAPSYEIYLARQELMKCDFLVIDEFDNRFMSSDNSIDLFARTLESIFRTRSQNVMPTLMCTNSPNILNSFNGSLKISLDSLLSGYLETIAVFGKDHRKI
jgi:DNA replication protein DnaC